MSGTFRIVAISIALCVRLIAGGQAPAGRPAAAEDISGCTPSVQIPPRAVRALLRTKEGAGARDYLSESSEHEVSEVFRAAQMHLSHGTVDLVVCGTGVMTTGADNDWHWLVSGAYSHPRVVLFAPASNAFELLPGRTHGLRDVRSFWNSPNESVARLFQFDGTRYKMVKERRTPIEP